MEVVKVAVDVDIGSPLVRAGRIVDHEPRGVQLLAAGRTCPTPSGRSLALSGSDVPQSSLTMVQMMSDGWLIVAAYHLVAGSALPASLESCLPRSNWFL